MQINKYLDIFGGITNEDIPSGRMVILEAPTTDEAGVYGVALPGTEDEAKMARFCLDWTPTNQRPPYLASIPSESWALRGGWDKAANTPFETVYSATYWGDYEDYTIPSGTLVRLFGAGAVLTVASGQFIPDDIVKGCALKVSYSGGNAGKLEYSESDTNPIAIAEEFDAAAFRLTFRIL